MNLSSKIKKKEKVFPMATAEALISQCEDKVKVIWNIFSLNYLFTYYKDWLSVGIFFFLFEMGLGLLDFVLFVCFQNTATSFQEVVTVCCIFQHTVGIPTEDSNHVIFYNIALNPAAQIYF